VLCVLKVMGLFESQLDAKVQPLYGKHRASRSATAAGARESLEAARGRRGGAEAARLDCLALLGEHVFAEGEQTLAGALARSSRRAAIASRSPRAAPAASSPPS